MVSAYRVQGHGPQLQVAASTGSSRFLGLIPASQLKMESLMPRLTPLVLTAGRKGDPLCAACEGSRTYLALVPV
jgi:hypothetical protein